MESILTLSNPPTNSFPLQVFCLFIIFFIFNLFSIFSSPPPPCYHGNSSLGGGASRVSGRGWEDNGGGDERERDGSRRKVSSDNYFVGINLHINFYPFSYSYLLVSFLINFKTTFLLSDLHLHFLSHNTIIIFAFSFPFSYSNIWW